MEFNFDIAKAFGNCDKSGICILNGLHHNKYPQKNNDNISKLLDEIGNLSAKSQELKSVITTGMKFFGTDQRIYLKCDAHKFIGFIKVGKKKLFIYDEIGSIKELNPLCVLDFYVYEGCQRTGFGKEIFLKMIECETIEPRKMGYDRPSSKLMSFLKKHFQLADYVPQNNNYVVFNDYFRPAKIKSEGNSYSSSSEGSQSQQKTFHQFKKDIYEGNNNNNMNNMKQIDCNKEQYLDKYIDTKSNQNANQDYIKEMTLPYNYQYTSSSSEYGAFLNVNPKQNYHYYK